MYSSFVLHILIASHKCSFVGFHFPLLYTSTLSLPSNSESYSELLPHKQESHDLIHHQNMSLFFQKKRKKTNTSIWELNIDYYHFEFGPHNYFELYFCLQERKLPVLWIGKAKQCVPCEVLLINCYWGGQNCCEIKSPFEGIKTLPIRRGVSFHFYPN